MKRIIAILVAASLADAACAAETTYWFLLRDKDNAWCAYTNQAVFLERAGQVVSWNDARAEYHDHKLTKIYYSQTSESGDYAVEDTYSFNGDGIFLERVETRLAPFYRITSAARIGGRQPKPLHPIKAEPKGVTATVMADGPIPQLPIKRSAESFPFLKLVPTLRSAKQHEVCAR